MERISSEALPPSGTLTSLSATVANAHGSGPRSGYRLKAHAASSSDFILAAVFACALFLFAGGIIFVHTYDNDVWFFLATGEYITQHGIPYTNPFSIQPDMGFIAQQWLHCVITYLIYEAGGFVALGVWTLILFFALAASMFALARKLRTRRGGMELTALLVAIFAIASSVYASVRPHLYSMLAFIWLIYLLESYRHEPKRAYLVGLPLIVVVHVNLHAAIAPFDLLIVALYCIPDVASWFHARGKLKGLSLADAAYPRLPILIALLACVAALFVNPYGIYGAGYVFLSFGAASYKDRINEMGSFIPAHSYMNVLNTALMFITTYVIGRMGAKRVNLPLLLLAVIGMAGALAFVRNQWLSSLFCFAYLAWASRGAHVKVFTGAVVARRVALCIMIAGVAGMAALMVKDAPELADHPTDDAYTPVAAMDYLDSIGADKDTTKVFTFFNAGGYIEFRGYKVNVDPRPEIWNSSINGTGKDYYFEYVEMSMGNMAFNRYNDKHDFDVFIIDSGAGTDPYFQGNAQYVELLAGDGYRAYAKRSWLDQYV